MSYTSRTYSSSSSSSNSSESKKMLDNRANQFNSTHSSSGPGRPSGYQGTRTKKDLDNHANQLNANYNVFRSNKSSSPSPYSSRGSSKNDYSKDSYSGSLFKKF